MENVTLAIECDADSASSLSTALSNATQSEVAQAEKNSLDGSIPTVLQLVQVAASVAAAVAPIVASYIANGRVKKIKVGDIEIENPTREQWERLWEEHLGRKSDSGPKA